MYQHKQFQTVEDRISGMTWMKSVIDSLKFDGRVFAMCQAYSRWEIDQIIGTELQRNLLWAMICVLVATLIFLADFRACFFVFLCVTLNLVNVVGFMHFWGLTIDIVASTNIIISVGLCVDFSAHVAHSFMHNRQVNFSKNEKFREIDWFSKELISRNLFKWFIFHNVEWKSRNFLSRNIFVKLTSTKHYIMNWFH